MHVTFREMTENLEGQSDAQLSGQPYDLNVNLAVLKAYQLNPELLKMQSVAKILIMALMQLPHTDYLACTYLVPEHVLDDEPVRCITTAATLLECCRFREVWQALQPLRQAWPELTPHLDASLRTFILRTFEMTYQSVPTVYLRASLHCSCDSHFVTLLTERGWMVDGELIKIALNDDNTAKTAHIDSSEFISSVQMTSILSSIASST